MGSPPFTQLPGSWLKGGIMAITEVHGRGSGKICMICIECKEVIRKDQYYFKCELREKVDDTGKSYRVKGEPIKYVHSGCFITKKWGAK